LFSTSSLLDDSEHHRSHWVLGTGDFKRLPVAYPWIVQKDMAVPFGLMMTFDDNAVWTVHRGGKKRGKASYALVAAGRPDPADPANRAGDFEERSSRIAAGYSWTSMLPLRPRAMIRAGDVLFVGGMPDQAESMDDAAADDATMTPAEVGLLRADSAATGEALGELRLSAPPVWDGMAATEGRLYLALEDGCVVCLGPP
jgi:hypothetical protein